MQAHSTLSGDSDFSKRQVTILKHELYLLHSEFLTVLPWIYRHAATLLAQFTSREGVSREILVD